MSTYEEGYQACLDGFGISVNPYVGEKASSWEDGWCEAFEENYESDYEAAIGDY